jgi:glutamate-1-semialdehyde aminotransferase
MEATDYRVFVKRAEGSRVWDEDLAQLNFGQLIEFWRTMQQEGVLTFMASRWFMSIVHTDADVERILEAADKCMAGLQ